MRKFKFLTVILSLMVFLGSFAACNFTTGSKHVCESVCEVCGGCMDEECTKKACKEKCDCEAEEPAPEHTCESECDECGGCTNADCEEEACETKCDCEAEEPAPEHTCESVCDECGGCKNADCNEEACQTKCDCEAEEPAPEHTCESVCEECGGCTNADCNEEACQTKCDCEAEEPAPEHTCESVCEECGGCTNADCNEEACQTKCDCEAEEPAPEHTCESVCETCGGCTNADCNEEACVNKCECEAEEPAPEHTCESVCETCGGCLDAECTEEACANKCQGHHTCESICETCGGCLDAECTEEACANKCQGHHTCESVCEICGGCLDAECTEEACENKCPGHHVCESVCPKCLMCQDATCTEQACKSKCPGHVEGAEWDMYDLKVVSFNVKIPGTAPDGCSWTQRSPNILNYLNNSGAHIIGLQEVSETPRKDIVAGINKDKYEFLYFGDDASNLAMIYDKTVFNLIRTEKYWMSDTPDKKSNGWDAGNYRAACILYLEHKETGEMVQAINTHGPLSDEGNIKGFNLIAERSLSSDTPMFTVLTGDFNARPVVPASRPNELGYQIIAEKLQDTRVAAAESPCRWHTTFSDFNEDTKNSHNSTAQLDHIFVTRSEDVEVLTYKVNLESGSAPFLSDHYPIESTMRIYNPANSWTEFQ